MENLWDQRYAAEAYVYGREPNDWFVEKLKILKPGKLLLPAEGEGRNAVWAALQGWQVTAFDQSFEAKSKALKLAEEKGANTGIDYLVKDLRCFRCEENYFDVLALIYVHMPSDFRSKVHTELLKMVRPGGCVILEAFSKDQITNSSGGPQNLDLLYDANEIKEDFKALKLLEFHNIKIHLEEGELHHGIANVIRLFGRKQ